MPSIEEYISNKIVAEKAKAKQITNAQNTLEANHPFIYNNPALSEIVKGAYDTAKVISDAGAYAQHLISGEPTIQANLPFTDSVKTISQAEKTSPRYNKINEMASMIPQGIALEASGTSSLLSKFGGSLLGKVVSKELPIANKIAEKTGQSLGEGFGFTTTDPHALTGEGEKVYNQNTFDNFDPASIATSTIETGAMVGAGRLVPPTIKIAKKATSNAIDDIKNIKENVLDSVSSLANKIKPKYGINGTKKEARVYTDTLKTENNVFNKTKHFSDVNLFDKNNIKNITNSLEEDHTAIIHSSNESNINMDKIKKSSQPKKDILLLFIPDKKYKDISIIENKSGISQSEEKLISEHFGITPNDINKLISENNVILYTDKAPDSKYLQHTLEHEAGHIINIDKQGYAQPFKGFSENKKINNLIDNGYKKDELYYYMNQQEATQQLGSIAKRISDDNSNNFKLNNNEKEALTIYSKFTNNKIDFNSMSKKDLLDHINNISDELENFFEKNRPNSNIKPIQMASKPHARTRAIEELKHKVIEHLKNTSGKLYDTYTELKDSINVASKTRKEHIKTLKQLNNEISKANKANNIKREISLKKEKYNYIQKLYKMFGFDNSEKISRLNKDLEDIEKKISNAMTNSIEEDKRGSAKKIDGKIQYKQETPYDKHLINEYQRITKELSKEDKNIAKTLNNVFMNKKLFNDLQIFRINELIQKHNDLLIDKASEMKISEHEQMSIADLKNELQKNSNIEQIELTKRSGSKKVKTAFEKDQAKKTEPMTNAEKKKKNNELLYKTEQYIKNKKIEGTTKEEAEKWLNEQKWNEDTKKAVKNIIDKIYKDKHTKSKNKISNHKKEPAKEKATLQNDIDSASSVSFEYIKHHLKKIYFSVKAIKPQHVFNINIKEILDKISDANIIDGYYDSGSLKNIYRVSFQADNHTMNFLNETRLLAHELTHLFIENVKNNKDFLNLQIPKKIQELYKDKNILTQKEESIALYTELRSMQDLIKSSNVSKLVEDKNALYNKIQKEIENVFGSNISYYENFYRQNMQYNIFHNLKKMYKNPIFNHKYFFEQADAKMKDIIDKFIKNIYEKVSKNTSVKDFIDNLNGKDFIKNAIEDYKISHSHEALYENIRKIISSKNKMMNTIKNLNNSFVKMVSNDFKNINTKTQLHIHNSDILNSFVGSAFSTLKDFIDSMEKDHKLLFDNFTKNNLSGNVDKFKEIIKQSSIPMDNNKLYFRNAEQIAKYLQKHKMLKSEINNSLLHDINTLLTSEYLKNNKIDSNLFSHIKQDSGSVLVAKEIRNKAKKVLGDDYIRGYRSFIPKNPLIAKLGLFDREPTYSIDLRNSIDNNLLEFKQDGILGSEFRLQSLTEKSKLKLNTIKKKLDNQKIPYSIIYDKDMNEIGVKRYIEGYLDEKNMGINFDIAENIASQHTSIMLNTVNHNIAKAITKDLNDIFLSNKDIRNIKTTDGYVLLSNEEQKIFQDISDNPAEQIKYIKKEFKDLLNQQQEFLFSKENQRIARTIEKSYKDMIKEFKKNVVVKNIKSQLNNAIIILTTTAQHNLNTGSVLKDIIRSPKEYKIFYETIYNIRKEALNGNNKKARIMFENLRRQNVYSQMYQNGLFQTMADNHLMKVSGKESLQSYHINKFISEIFNDDATSAVNKIKDFVLLEPNTFLGSQLLKSMNFIDITGRATLYKNLLKKGHSIAEASRITNESFVDFRRTYPKIVNELDNYGLFFAGFMYKNSINLLKFMKDKPVTSASVILSYLAITKLFQNTSPVNVKTDSWLYQGSMATPSYIDMSMFGSLSKGKIPKQLVMPNTTLMIEHAVKSGDISKILPITTGGQYK